MHPIEIHVLPGLGALHISGADAGSFLQGQLTADLSALAAGATTLAAWCSPQGRVIALLRIATITDGFLALLPHELSTPVADRLRRFVMRAKVVVTDVSDTLAVAGVSGRGLGALDASPPLAADVTLLRLSASRELLVGRQVQLDEASAGLPRAVQGAWEMRCIVEGEPEVHAVTSESWVPQMLNLDLLGAISFAKGCYPGQEIVARTQNLGRIKRRMFAYRVTGTTLPAAGDPLYRGRDKVGEVVRSIQHGNDAMLLAVVNLDAAGIGLTDERGGATCSPQPLPYAVPEAPAAP